MDSDLFPVKDLADIPFASAEVLKRLGGKFPMSRPAGTPIPRDETFHLRDVGGQYLAVLDWNLPAEKLRSFAELEIEFAATRSDGDEIIFIATYKGVKVTFITLTRKILPFWTLDYSQTSVENPVVLIPAAGGFTLSVGAVTLISDLTRADRALNEIIGNNVDTRCEVLKRIYRNQGAIAPEQLAGVRKNYLAKEALFQELQKQFPAQYAIWKLILAQSSSSAQGVKGSTVINQELESAQTVADLVEAADEALKRVVSANSYWIRSLASVILPGLGQFREKRKQAIKSQVDRAFSKIISELGEISLDPQRFPLTYQAFSTGEIPTSIIFRNETEQFFLLNDCWELWEAMLEKHPEVTKQLAREAASRSHYEKDLMSYFYFILHGLPEYLQRHTGYAWTCVPKLVSSASELEPDKTTGTIKKRSALTPTVDNEAKIVTVPYASLAMGGSQTTYCYSLSYNIVQRGFTYQGYTAMKDIEEKLNGRDDYGLFFYTLTGSPTGRGYPSFLMIFERLEEGTRLYFHRVHPMRSKEYESNCVHNWVKACYAWMVGNINPSWLENQQGDLAFIRWDKPFAASMKWESVQEYDHHCFESPVSFSATGAKENILGYLHLDAPTLLRHTEHHHILLPAGNYQVRQCRSWEANPKGIWTLRID